MSATMLMHATSLAPPDLPFILQRTEPSEIIRWLPKVPHQLNEFIQTALITDANVANAKRSTT